MFQRLENFLRTDVSLGSHQHGKLENDIFVLHGMPRDLLDGMKLPGRYDDDVAFFRLERQKVYSHGPTPFFDIDNFHVIVPVGRHYGKIKGDAAKVYVEWETVVTMAFCFLGTFIRGRPFKILMKTFWYYEYK